MKKFLPGTLLIFFLFIGSAISDTYLVQKIHTDGYSVAGTNVPANDQESVTWSSGDKIKISSGSDTSMIMRMDKKKLYIIYSKSKEYSELDLDELKNQMESAKSVVADAAAASGVPAAFASMMQFSATVNPSKESKKIGKWNCTRYDITLSLPMGTTAITKLWSSTDINIDYSNLATMKNFTMSQMPGFASMLKEYEKVKGFPVLTETTTKVMDMEIKTRDELVEVSEKKAPAGIYDIPAGFKKIDLE